MDISVVIPVLHEEKNIGRVLLRLEKNIKASYEVLVVYDSSSDPTIDIVKKFIYRHETKNILVVKNSIGTKRGVMNAIKTGFLKAKGRAIVVLMADLSDDISQIDHVYSLIQRGFDIVCASRFMKGGKKLGGPFMKTFLSRLAGACLYYIAHIPTHDATNAFKMYRRRIFDDIQIESTGGFEYSLEILVKAYKKGYKITEIPTVWKDRVSGKSNFQLRAWLPQYIKWFLFAFDPY